MFVFMPMREAFSNRFKIVRTRFTGTFHAWAMYLREWVSWPRWSSMTTVVRPFVTSCHRGSHATSATSQIHA
jgi:hypothetical protein